MSRKRQPVYGTVLVEHAAKFTVFSGIAGSGKSTALLAIYRAALDRALAQSRPGDKDDRSPCRRQRKSGRA